MKRIMLITVVLLAAGCVTQPPAPTARPQSTATPLPPPAPTLQTFDDVPGDINAWERVDIPFAPVVVPFPPGWERVEGPVEGLPFDYTIAAVAPVEGCTAQCPEIGVTVWANPGTDWLRAWLEQVSTAEPFGSTTGDDVHFFDVSNVEPRLVAERQALAFTHDRMGVEVESVIMYVAYGEGLIYSFSRTHLNQSELEHVFEMMLAGIEIQI